MHLLHVPDSIDSDLRAMFEPADYLIEDRNGAEIMMQQPMLRATMTPWTNTVLSPDPKNILVVGTAGFGDTFLLTPVLRELKRLHPEATLRIACHPEYRQVYIGLPYIDGYAPYPLPVEYLKSVDQVYTLEHSVQFNDLAKVEHMTDRFAHHFGLKDFPNKKPDYKISRDELRWINEKFPRGNRKRLGVQIQAGVRCRTYPAWVPKELGSNGSVEREPKLEAVITGLVKEGWEIALLGRPGESKVTNVPYVHNIASIGLSFRQSVAYLRTCDAFLGPDSSLLHAAGTLDVPAVGLFGPFPWSLRTKYYTSVFSIQGKEGCDLAPCHHVKWPGLLDFPIDGPCATKGICVPLASIKPEQIIAKVRQISRQSEPAVAASPEETIRAGLGGLGGTP